MLQFVHKVKSLRIAAAVRARDRPGGDILGPARAEMSAVSIPKLEKGVFQKISEKLKRIIFKKTLDKKTLEWYNRDIK